MARIDVSDFDRAARDVRRLASDLVDELGQGLRDQAPLVGRGMVRGAAAVFPRRGGLAADLADTDVDVEASGFGGTRRITVGFRQRDGYDLAALDDGTIHHPVYGRGPIVAQRGPRDSFQRALDVATPAIAGELADRLDRAIRQGVQ
ncbi:hypothetical protein KMZ30_07285 [Phycicoccus sp. KQZ13P-1]|uniref:hypothetical protein n=1 Tax=Phycicoccus mangrovi TaxID=2840470 RepID=UPI001C00229C|nr:hypothetical protein [Phycicoccus mangrovi]MBT9255374.1 hypothetical protein [Phycicoccus mangrovi]